MDDEGFTRVENRKWRPKPIKDKNMKGISNGTQGVGDMGETSGDGGLKEILNLDVQGAAKIIDAKGGEKGGGEIKEPRGKEREVVEIDGPMTVPNAPKPSQFMASVATSKEIEENDSKDAVEHVEDITMNEPTICVEENQEVGLEHVTPTSKG
ncbi:hypothetical protein L6452_42180 [Arctium lappa]|uniref:Uncharacterized protein n=1 Tax=Arctium lappa TaxID=4217 RepID=A0ACB8XI50_ARCLA|nr:hypothetical protein L6452_42180 [Arctium lappa]